MSGLLSRLVIRALGAPTGTPQPIRAAARIHPRAPVAMPAADRQHPNLEMPVSAETRESRAAPEPRNTPAIVSVVAPVDRNATLGELPSAPQEAERNTRSGQTESVTGSRSDRTVQVRSAGTDEPVHEWLLPPAPPPAAPPISVKPLPAPAWTDAHPRQDSASTEVHVHIGRIEVTAIQEAAASAKPRAIKQTTRPLSEYLARGSRS